MGAQWPTAGKCLGGMPDIRCYLVMNVQAQIYISERATSLKFNWNISLSVFVYFCPNLSAGRRGGEKFSTIFFIKACTFGSININQYPSV